MLGLRLLVFSFFFSAILQAQTVSGRLSSLSGQALRLEGFNGFKTYPISSFQCDQLGNFTLNYESSDFGVGYLMAADNKPLFLILSGEDIEISGQTLSDIGGIKVNKGRENQWFEKYASEHPRREQALSAWEYLERLYRSDSLFLIQQTPAMAIQEEKQRIKNEDLAFLKSLPDEAYVTWFLPMRKLVSSVSLVAQYRPDEIPATIKALRNIDYTDKRLYKSGLLKDAIESHFWLLENCGKPLDSVFFEMRISIDAMIAGLMKDEKRLNEVSDFLFDLLEKHSLFQASEYLALKVLNEVSCTINSDLAKQLETYRAMKKGNTAPDIVFPGTIIAPSYAGQKVPARLSEIKTRFTVVVFGASWCPKCSEELPEISSKYAMWKTSGVEVVFVSLDENEDNFRKFTKDFPFISMCDFKKWEGQVVKDYYVFATPTMYLLDQKREIILRPNSVNQMHAWVDWYLIKGNLKQ